jgi:hypothetical protein
MNYPESAVDPWLKNHGYRAETENLIRNHFCDLASQILGLLRCLKHFTVRNLNDELHTSLPRKLALSVSGGSLRNRAVCLHLVLCHRSISTTLTHCLIDVRPVLTPVAAQKSWSPCMVSTAPPTSPPVSNAVHAPPEPLAPKMPDCL